MQSQLQCLLLVYRMIHTSEYNNHPTLHFIYTPPHPHTCLLLTPTYYTLLHTLTPHTPLYPHTIHTPSHPHTHIFHTPTCCPSHCTSHPHPHTTHFSTPTHLSPEWCKRRKQTGHPLPQQCLLTWQQGLSGMDSDQ